MGIKILFVFFICAISNKGNSQDFSVKKKELIPHFIDTLNSPIFIFEVPNAILYFKQNEISNFINDPANKKLLGTSSYQTLSDTLKTKTKAIRVYSIPESTNDREFDSLFIIYKDSFKLQSLNTDFYIIGGALMLRGNFMIYSITERKFVQNGILAKAESGVLGQKRLNYYLPNKERFYSIVTRLGE